ncbi:putative bifunctional diguanylate cyclase/phosphodiesterase [Pseudomonas kurunegalensis]|uniref:putative bifunctional diguanylate cyclase/phosphodiesterase n=1 Tax=Pseudomonas kurunegalensis TaxID=485880 RepID=UPI002117A864|nr:EAL domain-containing protein [Pseudomonas kurunegalensis]
MMKGTSESVATAYLHLLKEVAVAANEAIGVEAALHMALRSICQGIGWAVGHALKSQPGEGLASTGIWHVEEDYPADSLAAFRQATEAQCFASGAGLPGRVLAEGLPLEMSDARTAANFPRRAAALQAGLTAGFALPIRSGNSISAVLEFYNPLAQQLSPELLDVMEQIGVLLGRVFERHAAQSALQTSEQRSRQIIDSAGDAFIAMDAQGIITDWNKTAETIFGWSKAEAVGQAVSDTIVPAQYRDAHARGLARFLSHGKAQVLGQRLELPALHRDGREFPIEITLWSLEEDYGWSFFAFAHDITARKAAEQELEHRALHDPLTGLPNRVLVLDRLQQCLARRDEATSGLAVLFIDLDHFKRINDSFGHDAGDQVLITVAQRLQRAMRPADTVARLAGDEFVMVCPDVACYRDATVIARRLQEALVLPIHLNEDNLFVAASIGIAMATSGCDAEKLIGSADIAMYEAKTGGRARYQLFDEQMQMQVTTRLHLENDLHRALVCGEFRLYFQPVIAAASGAVVSVEALLRWQHPEKGLLLPAEFIPVAEDTGLIVPIGIWVIEETCRLAKTWSVLRDAGLPLGVAVNLSARQLIQSDLVETVQRIFRANAFDATRIEFGFEVTETAVMGDPAAAASTLQALRDLGAHISIDDFGTGYSSLAYLKRFPVDTLKVDRSFVMNIPDDHVDQAIVRAVTDLAHSMQLTVVAEGVETAEQAQVLRHLNVDLLQGFLYARPMPAEQLENLLHRRQSQVS